MDSYFGYAMATDAKSEANNAQSDFIQLRVVSQDGVTTNEIHRHASEQQPMKFYCEKVGGVSGEIGTRPFLKKTITLTKESQLTDFPMYRLAEVEVAALYPRIREVALNRGYQGYFKITNYTFWIEIDPEDCRFMVHYRFHS
ncbi:hypothetical protein T09_14858 [Trichinella sp. T9]|nr:hypothetical protein T09_14858 [Trichinella sp. T9]